MLNKVWDKIYDFLFGKTESKPPKIQLTNKSHFTYTNKERIFLLANLKTSRI